ncbi:GAF and ANTAR domain-containing protein [Geodermatophilus amargosae]|uniref:GAF and ANTAR domain-containing protein n=1 Tax=Geodermatophilus amargosae TaxID=1296565 RepID=UPI00158756CA|nr:GAF and ANTAR domain-containing protein [Geodermatophilus amargosae]
MAGVRVAGILAALVAAGPSASWPDHLVEACRRATGVTGVGLALVDHTGVSGVVAATPGVGRELEDLQFSLGEGPCTEASRSGRPVMCPDLADDGGTRWPAFARGAGRAGVSAAFTFPLQVGAIALGVLDLYRTETGPLRGPYLTEAVAHADAAVAVLLHLQGRDDEAGATGLADLADRRAVVHQAAGMVAVQLDVDVADALRALRAHAWAHDRAIGDVAGDVVARRLRFHDSGNGTAGGAGVRHPGPGPGGEPA